jgi:DNA-binding NtrC family response regulator
VRSLFWGTPDFAVPPLRDRPEDIDVFSENFLRRFARKHGLRLPGFSDHAIIQRSTSSGNPTSDDDHIT